MARPESNRPALIVHAGAWDLPEEEKDAHLAACRTSIACGWEVLAGGGTALQAVEAAVVAFEDDPAINAGTGSTLCREGWVEMDAAVMDGGTLEAAGVCGVRDVPNPIVLAGRLLGRDAVLLAGAAATAFAREQGMALCDPARLVVPREVERFRAWRKQAGRSGRGRDAPGDTVGAVAADAAGRFAAATSTGGRTGKRSGRIGDAPIPGAGLWADDRLGGVACTGEGEAILRIGLAHRALDLARTLTAEDAAWGALQELRDRVRGLGGLILITPRGGIGYGYSTPSMPFAYVDAEMGAPRVGGVGGR